MSERKSQLLLIELGQKPKLVLVSRVQIFSLDIICSSKLTVLFELRSRKTVHFPEQRMSADKYPSIFSLKMEAIDGFTLLVASWVISAGKIYKEAKL